MELTENRFYCPEGGFYIDPWCPVERAVITHAHSDHAIAGHGAVLATRETLDIVAIRLGDGFAGATQAAAFGERVVFDGATVSFHPAQRRPDQCSILRLSWRSSTRTARARMSGFASRRMATGARGVTGSRKLVKMQQRQIWS